MSEERLYELSARIMVKAVSAEEAERKFRKFVRCKGQVAFIEMDDYLYKQYDVVVEKLDAFNKEADK